MSKMQSLYTECPCLTTEYHKKSQQKGWYPPRANYYLSEYLSTKVVYEHYIMCQLKYAVMEKRVTLAKIIGDINILIIWLHIKNNCLV